MSKQIGFIVCIFLIGFIAGVMTTGIIGLSILDNRMDNLQPTITELNDQMLIFVETIRDNADMVKENNDLVINTNIVMENVLKMRRDEINSYHEAFYNDLINGGQ